MDAVKRAWGGGTESVTEALNEVHVDEGEAAGLDPLLDEMQLGSVPEDDR